MVKKIIAAVQKTSPRGPDNIPGYTGMRKEEVYITHYSFKILSSREWLIFRLTRKKPLM